MRESRTRELGRFAAFIAGLAILIGAATVSVGVVLCAPIGVWVVNRFQRSRGRPLSALGSWAGAVSAVIVALILIAGVVASRLPAGTWSRIRQTADSASTQAARQPPPAWLDRLMPGASTSYSIQRSNRARPFNAFTMILGGGVAAVFFGNLIGTVGWIGTMLLVFAASGRWLREAPAVATEFDDA